MAEQPHLDFYKLSFLDIQRFRTHSVHLSRPRILHLYDVDGEKISSATRLKYFRKPKLSEFPLDLNEAFKTFRFHKLSAKTIASLTLNYDMTLSGVANAIKYDGKCIDGVERTRVYTRRGILRYIMEFCFAPKFDSDILISRHDGNLYLFEFERELQDWEKLPRNTHHSRLCRQVFVDEPNGFPDLEKPYDEYKAQQYSLCCSLGNFNLTYSCAFDGILSDAKFYRNRDIRAVNKQRFVLAKQMWMHLRNDDAKLLNYWIQARLVNVEDIFIAYKDQNGIINEPLEHIKASEIPKNRRWKPRVCIAFLNEFLERVEELMKDVNSFETVYEFHFRAKGRSVKYEIHKGNQDKIVVPKEYIEFATRKEANWRK